MTASSQLLKLVLLFIASANVISANSNVSFLDGELSTTLNTFHYDGSSDFRKFEHFIAQNSTMKCFVDDHVEPFDYQVRGTCIGGWLVLEPWITPSMFYQFLGGNEGSTAMDMHSFCSVLGPVEGNKQLRRHWDAWVTEEIIAELALVGRVNSLRLPVGDWMYVPYGPYINCTDGSLEYVDKLLDWALKYNLTVLLDIHGIKDSQNGFDNSGQTSGFEWTSLLNDWPIGLVTFEHWPVRSAKWMGKFDRYTGEYTSINYDNIRHALDVIEAVVLTHKNHPAVLGLEPLNEPWEKTPIDHLKRFYWEAYLIVKEHAPLWKYVIHDSFRLDTNVWGGFMEGCPDRALDTHIYQAWNIPASQATFYNYACQAKSAIASMEQAFGPVIVGEWSLATDNCAMWLNGFNDNLPGYPMLPCKHVRCPDPYMGPDQPGTPIDPAKPIQGPFGTGMSGPSYGMCPVSRDWTAENSDGMNWILAPPEAPEGYDATDDVMKNLALKKINTFSVIGHGFYFWNFRTELPEPQWSYMLAVQKGWIPSGPSLNIDEVAMACEKEDNGQYKCIAKRGMLSSNVINGMRSCVSRDPSVEPKGTNVTQYEDLDDEELATVADDVFNDFWTKHRLEGVTCDFGGVAQLMELNYTYVPRFVEPTSRGWTIKHPIAVAVCALIIMVLLFTVFGFYMMRRGADLREQTLRKLGAIRNSFARFSYARLGDATNMQK